MAKRKQASIQDLRNQLLSELKQKRDELREELESVENEMAAVSGSASASKASGTKAAGRKKLPAAGANKTQKAARKAKKGAGRRGRRAAGQTLQDYLVAVLKKADGPMRVKDLMTEVKKAGYKTDSKDFYGIVAAALRDKEKFENVSRGQYQLKK